MTTWHKCINCDNQKAFSWYLLKYISIKKYDIDVLICVLLTILHHYEIIKSRTNYLKDNIMVMLIDFNNWICFNSSKRSCICSWIHLNSARLSSSKYGRDGRNPRAQDRGSPGAFSLPSLNILIVRLLWIEHSNHSPPILLVVDDVN